jgi:hypothetical protein
MQLDAAYPTLSNVHREQWLWHEIDGAPRRLTRYRPEEMLLIWRGPLHMRVVVIGELGPP